MLLDGNHSIDECFAVTEATLREVFYHMGLQRTELETMLLKPSMVLSGKDAPDRASPEEVAERTITCFKRAVPAAIPGILFLSGGQTDEEASLNLNAICAHAARVGVPWQFSFSFARALEGAPMQAWAGNPENKEAAQQAFRHRASIVSAARRGAYKIGMQPERMTI